MNLEAQGVLIEIYPTEVISEKFKKRSFVIEMSNEYNGATYYDYAQMQLTQAKTDILDRFSIGDNVKVTFNLKGRRNESNGQVRYFNELAAWKIEKA